MDGHARDPGSRAKIAVISRDKLGRRMFRTKGDANRSADPWTFALPEGEQARVRVGVP